MSAAKELLTSRIALLAIGFALVLIIGVAPTASAAPDDPNGQGTSDSSCDGRFLTLPAWYNGVTDSDCSIMSPSDYSGGPQAFIWRIALNIIDTILQVIGYVALAFIIYGGFQFIVSSGSPDGMARARKTLTNAVIGLIVAMAAVIIVKFIVGVMA